MFMKLKKKGLTKRTLHIFEYACGKGAMLLTGEKLLYHMVISCQ